MTIPKKKRMTMGKRMTKSIAVRMTPEDRLRLEKVAEADNKYIADWMRVAIFEAVRKHEFAQVQEKLSVAVENHNDQTVKIELILEELDDRLTPDG